MWWKVFYSQIVSQESESECVRSDHMQTSQGPRGCAGTNQGPHNFLLAGKDGPDNV